MQCECSQNFVVAHCEKQQKHSTLQSMSNCCTLSDVSQGSLSPSNSKSCCTCSKYSGDDYRNGEVDCGSDIASAAATKHSDEAQLSSSCARRNCESNDLSHAAASQEKMTAKLLKCKTCTVTNACLVEPLEEDISTNTHNSTSEVQSQSPILVNGSHSDKAVNSDSFQAEVNAESEFDNAAPETAKLCSSSVDSSCVSESTRQNILDAAETFASIIGQEIAASFSLKDDKESSVLCQGSDGDTFSLAHCSTSCTAGSVSSATTLVTGLKSAIDDRKQEADGGPALDTVEVARRVRDILTANNVGQRQFARYVLGLSQGTVSELLAKPKPWGRLTEKGKESYRRMSRWADDHLGVLSLKDHLNSVALKANPPSPKGTFTFCFWFIMGHI